MKLKSVVSNMMVEDVNKTVAFYIDVLGFELFMSVPEEGKLDWAWVKRDNVDFMFQTRESIAQDATTDMAKEKIGASLAYFIDMDGIRELYDRIKDKVTIVNDLHDTFYGKTEFIIKDLNGYLLNFAEDTKK